MTTPSVDRPVSEPMTDAELDVERHYLSLGGGVTWPAGEVARFFATIDALKSRALPLPRRYTGGPLEDGVYLFRRPTWHPVNWTSFGVAEDFANPYVAPRLLAGEWVWLIGPITIIPDLPSEEASS